MKKYYLFFIALLGVFFFVKNASAAAIYSQSVIATTTVETAANAPRGNGIYVIAGSSSSTPITDIYLWGKIDSPFQACNTGSSNFYFRSQTGGAGLDDIFLDSSVNPVYGFEIDCTSPPVPGVYSWYHFKQGSSTAMTLGDWETNGWGVYTSGGYYGGTFTRGANILGGNLMYTMSLNDFANPTGIQLSFPVDSTSTQNFQNWVALVSSLSEGTLNGNSSYRLGVWYSRNADYLNNLTPGQGNVNGSVFVDTSLIYFNDYTGSDTQCINGGNYQTSCYQWAGGNNFYLSIPKFTRLPEGQWYAIPYISYSPIASQTSSSISFGQPQILAQGSLVSFTVSSTASLPGVSTTTNLAAGLPANNTSSAALNIGIGNTVKTPVFTPATTTTSFIRCLYSGVSSTFNFWNGSDWQCLGLNTLDILGSDAQDTAGGAVVNAVGALSNIFPISLIANFNQDIAVAANAAATLPLQDVSIGNGNANIFMGRTFTFYSASTTTNWCQNNLHFDCRGGISEALYAVTGIALLVMTLGAVKTFKHQKA